MNTFRVSRNTIHRSRQTGSWKPPRQRDSHSMLMNAERPRNFKVTHAKCLVRWRDRLGWRYDQWCPFYARCDASNRTCKRSSASSLSGWAWLIFNFYDATTPKLLIAVLRSIASHGVSSDRVSSTRPCQQTICNFISEMWLPCEIALGISQGR